MHTFFQGWFLLKERKNPPEKKGGPGPLDPPLATPLHSYQLCNFFNVISDRVTNCQQSNVT